MVPYCICFYDGENTFSFYLTDFKDSESMLTHALKTILTDDSYSDFIVYAHNFSKFDGIFVMRRSRVLLAKELNFKVSIIKKESDFINISLSSQSTGFKIIFRDSLLLLPSSLRKLAKSFGVIEKSIFPYDFVNDPNVDMNYSGSVPDFKYFSNITFEQYTEYSKYRYWSLRKETIRYCLLDCVVLYKVLVRFSNSIFKDLKVNLKFAPTTSSLALRTFRTSFLIASGVKFIPIIHGETYDFIKQSFTGGKVDVFKPYGKMYTIMMLTLYIPL
uniref:Probable DNA polymerase n=1 Tax=Phanerochaete carnosa TaxID=231932 RepID=A0A895KWX5_9APHY|nr:DNA polymerase type B [Phanerochaete carnosa]QRZ60391.1 DNA polymerase type B [Phanerochaete carnosa]